MVSNFYSDLYKAQKAEQLVCDTLTTLMPDYTFTNVGNIPYYYHKGDIRGVDEFGNEIMIEVKDDSRIADTRNILCEESVYYFHNHQTKQGNFYSDYEIYTVVSKSERKIYVFDFAKLKEIYKNYEKRCLTHTEQMSIVYLVPLWGARKHNAIIAEINY